MRHTKLSHHDVEGRGSNNVESSLTEEDSHEQIPPARTTPPAVSWSAQSIQPSSSIQRSQPRSGSEGITMNTSDIPQTLSGFHAPLPAQPVLVRDDRQLGGEDRSSLVNLTNVTSYFPDQINFNVPTQHIGDSAGGVLDNIDYLWDWDLSAHDFLPATFFDSEQRLSDLLQTQIPRNNSSMDLSPALGGASVMQEVGFRQSAIAPPLYGRLPALEPDHELSNNERLPIQDLQPGTMADAQPSLAPGSPWNISVQTYKHTCDAFLPCARFVNDTFSFPSRRTLSRFLEAYSQEFHQHFPFLHVPTTIICSLAPELVLAMAAVGACYRYEDNRGYDLYIAA
jgi:hypothetical protein